MSKTLVISDTHFGSEDDLLRSPVALQLLEPHLQWADNLVLNGDVWDLTSADLTSAVDASRPLFKLISETVKKVYYLPGNHDYHFVAASSDRHQFSKLVGIADETPFRLYLAELLLKELTAEKVKIETAYPMIDIDGIVYHHGHYMTPHLRNLAWRMFDKLSWRLAGMERSGKILTSADYEAILAPLHELLYHSAQLPSSKQSRDSGEKILRALATILRAPGRVSRRLSAPFKSRTEIDTRHSPAVFQLTSPEQAVEAMHTVCGNLQLQAGQICFAHSHAPFDHYQSQDWIFHNSGSWVLDHREKHYHHYHALAWPGTVLAVENGNVTRHQLLADYSLDELEAMLREESSETTPRKKRFRLFKKRKAIF